MLIQEQDRALEELPGQVALIREMAAAVRTELDARLGADLLFRDSGELDRLCRGVGSLAEELNYLQALNRVFSRAAE
jgi:hypothetical protein